MFTKEEVGRGVEEGWAKIFKAAGYSTKVEVAFSKNDRKAIDLWVGTQIVQVKTNPIDALDHIKEGIRRRRIIPVIVGVPRPDRTNAHSALGYLQQAGICQGLPAGADWDNKQWAAIDEMYELLEDNIDLIAVT